MLVTDLIIAKCNLDFLSFLSKEAGEEEYKLSLSEELTEKTLKQKTMRIVCIKTDVFN